MARNKDTFISPILAINAITAINKKTKVYAASAPPANPHQKLVLSYSILLFFILGKGGF